MSASYFLSPHVHVCLAGRQVVLLDLERDKYLAIARTQPLARWVRGWPAPLADTADMLAAEAGLVADAATEVSGVSNELLAKMLAQGLLVTDPAQGKEAAPLVTERAPAAIVEFDLDDPPGTHLATVWQLFAAYCGARWALQHWPIKKVIEVAQRQHVTARPWDIGTVRALVTAFMRLRPLFYGSQGACLLDCLTLLRFLARHGVRPQWIFGVKTDPFYAHCWVQQHGFVFNDTPDHIKGFVPILAV